MNILQRILDLFKPLLFFLVKVVLISGGLVWILDVKQSIARELVSPFANLPSIKESITISHVCLPPPPAVRDLSISTAYKLGDFNKIDPLRAEARNAAVAPIHSYIGSLVRFGDEAMRSSGESQRGRQLCAERWLTAWAKQDALLGDVSSPDGAYERKWMLGAISLTYLKMYGAALPAMPPEPIALWMRRLIEQVKGEYLPTSRNRNNHYYWAGLAVAAAAIAIDDKDSFNWGLSQYDLGISSIDADGFLPLELARGQMALYYHSYSASALTMLSALGGVNGQRTDDPRLRRLVHKILNGLANPTSFAERTGEKQIWRGGPDSKTLAWLEVYRRISNDVAADDWIATYRPLGTIWLGGDTTHAFGVPDAPGHRVTSPLSGP